MIKFDLHIHSFASRYKESKGIVDASTIERAPILLQKLNDADVSLFSITDHNRFWPELYEELDKLIATDQFPNVQGLLAGVEFDVQIDPEMPKCHIITIFDAKNRKENYQKIREAIEHNKLEGRDDFYVKRDYEDLLREIGLDVILIACQRNSLDRHHGRHNSLSESTMEPEELLMTGYINALEFQRPNVEGILRDNLKNVPVNVGLVMGSDCHEWDAYPNHDSNQRNPQFIHSKAKILPTFKGLLMAVTSPETRINQVINRNQHLIQSISVGGVDIPLVNGLNAIVGENGSGKSTLLKVMHGATRERFVTSLKEKNRIFCDGGEPEKHLFIGQGQIVEKFDNKELFPQDHFLSIDHSSFRDSYSSYAKGILQYIKEKISANSAIDELARQSIQYNELINDGAYFIHIDSNDDFGSVENNHAEHNDELKELLSTVRDLRKDDYYKEFYSDIDQIIELVSKIYKSVHSLDQQIKLEKTVKNFIISAISGYDEKVNDAATSKEREQREFKAARTMFIDYIIDAVKKNSREIIFPEMPRIISGYSSNPKHGFSFNSEAAYHDRDVVNEFLSKMFTRDYANIDALRQIELMEDLVSAIKGCTDPNQIDTVFQKNLSLFLDEMCQCKNYIVDTTQGDEELGNTLGELSLAYFKYMTEHENEKSIFLIDQPEDHISNNNISRKLLRYFNSIRTKKQIIMVTHNPLLVVNQDVDQVLFIRKNGDQINVISGCLEYEHGDINILDLIAKNMDGGKDSIEKRLKVYGKENRVDDAAV